MFLYKAFIFDVDGTLYNNKKLKLYIFGEILRCTIRKPNTLKEIYVVRAFRKLRQSLIDKDIQNLNQKQYEIVADNLNIEKQRVQDIIHKWMFEIPLRYLHRCKYEGVDELWNILKAKQIAICIFSDYPVEDKLKALNLHCDLAVSSTDNDVSQLKPDPKGLFKISDMLGIKIKECLFIGNKEDKDGACAEKADMPYLIFKKSILHRNKNKYFSSYSELERMF